MSAWDSYRVGDDLDGYTTYGKGAGSVVTHDEEPIEKTSQILGPDGSPIRYQCKTERMSFIGFVPPKHVRGKA